MKIGGSLLRFNRESLDEFLQILKEVFFKIGHHQSIFIDTIESFEVSQLETYVIKGNGTVEDF